jgi:hypothetical protein
LHQHQVRIVGYTGSAYVDLLIVNAALNEVCNGIEVFEFDARIGADRERVAALLKEVGQLLDKMAASDK